MSLSIYSSRAQLTNRVSTHCTTSTSERSRSSELLNSTCRSSLKLTVRLWMSTLAPRSSRAVTLSSPRSWLRSRLEVLLGHVFYGKRKQDRCSIYHNQLGIGTVRRLSIFSSGLNCATCLSVLLDISTDTCHYVPKTAFLSTDLKIPRDPPLHPSPSFYTILGSGVECRVSVVSLVLVRVESGTAVFIQTRLLTEHWA